MDLYAPYKSIFIGFLLLGTILIKSVIMLFALLSSGWLFFIDFIASVWLIQIFKLELVYVVCFLLVTCSLCITICQYFYLYLFYVYACKRVIGMSLYTNLCIHTSTSHVHRHEHMNMHTDAHTRTGTLMRKHYTHLYTYGQLLCSNLGLYRTFFSFSPFFFFIIIIFFLFQFFSIIANIYVHIYSLFVYTTLIFVKMSYCFKVNNWCAVLKKNTYLYIIMKPVLSSSSRGSGKWNANQHRGRLSHP